MQDLFTQAHNSNKNTFCSIFNIVYKYNLLLVLKILSYTLYNNLTDEMQARNIMSARKRVYILTIHNNNHEAEQLGNAKASPLRM